MSREIKRGGEHALMEAKDEQALRDAGAPIRCCPYWPECSHMLAWYEEQREQPDFWRPTGECPPC